MDLNVIKIGQWYQVVAIHYDREKSARLATRGVFVGNKIRPLCKNKTGVLIEVNDAVFLLTRGIFEGIEVRAN